MSLSFSLPAAWGVAGVGVVAETGVVRELLLAAAARAAPRCMNFMVMRREDMVLAAGASFMGRRYSFWVDLGGGMVAVLWGVDTRHTGVGLEVGIYMVRRGLGMKVWFNVKKRGGGGM